MKNRDFLCTTVHELDLKSKRSMSFAILEAKYGGADSNVMSRIEKARQSFGNLNSLSNHHKCSDISHSICLRAT